MSAMSDLERASDLVSRMIPVGFSTPEDQQKAQGAMDQAALEILALAGEPEDSDEGLAALLQRMEKRLEDQSLRVLELTSEVEALRNEKLMRESERLLAKHGQES